MGEQLPVPPELQHLIEKRAAETDRREQQRRKGPPLPSDATQKANALERRGQGNRRGKRRRKSDS